MSEFLSRKHGSAAVSLKLTMKGISLLNPLRKHSICSVRTAHITTANNGVYHFLP